MSYDYRNLAVEELAASEAALKADIRALEERIVDLVLEAQTYRSLAHMAIHALHHLTRDHDRLRQELVELKDEYRGFRERILRDAGVTP